MKRVAAALFAIALAAFIPACAGKAPREEPSAPVPPPAAVSPPEKVSTETGTASWYGRDFHARRTASGEPFDMYGISAAHRTLPLGTVLRVTNLDNFKTITVKVNDRGPFVRNHMLALSYGAARELGAVSPGSVRVRIEAVEVPGTAGSTAVYTVQAASFAEPENAKTLKERLQRKYETVFIVTVETNIGTFYRVRVGSYATEEKAERIAGKLTLDGLEPMVVRKD